jgi:hypothetical protein
MENRKNSKQMRNQWVMNFGLAVLFTFREDSLRSVLRRKPEAEAESSVGFRSRPESTSARLHSTTVCCSRCLKNNEVMG